MGQAQHPATDTATSVRFLALVTTFLFWAAFFAVARLVFLLYHLPAGEEVPSGIRLATFRHGLRLDLAGAAYLSAIPGAALVLSALRPLTAASRTFVAGYMGFAILVGAVGVAADLEIYRHFDRRIDASLLGYLATPREAWISTAESPRVALLLIAACLAGAGWLLFRKAVWPFYRRLAPAALWRTAPTVLLIGALVIPARGGLQVVPVTASSAYFSSYDFANAAALNAWWVFFDSLYRGLDDRDNPYAGLPPDSARAAVAAALAPAGDRRAPVSVARPNLVMIVWEGASARAIGALGGVVDATPRFSALADEGILFRRFYAAGNRTDKGLAALLSSYPGLPRGSLMMVPGKSRSVPSVSRDLHAAGYRTLFVYGGELEFGSIQAYLRNHQYDVIVGDTDFEPASRSSKWGAPDSVAGSRFVRELQQATEPFFGVWLTLSSHEPFDIPGTADPGSGDWQGRYLKALGYADRAIANTIEAMRSEPWWARTLVIVVADHGRRIIPLDAAAAPQDADAIYHIPMLWLGGALTDTGTREDIASQLDIAPTIRDLAGIAGNGAYPWGRTLLRPSVDPFAYYGFDGGFGLVTGRGAMTYLHGAAAQNPAATAADQRLGRALLQLSYQDYLNR